MEDYKFNNEDVRSEQWKYVGNHFCVVVKHWVNGARHMWNVGMYIYQGHSLFDMIEEERDPIVCKFHKNGDFTFCHWYCNKDSVIESKFYETDYAHGWDEEFYGQSSMTIENAQRVFKDAEVLYNQLVRVDIEKNLDWLED